MQLENKIYVGKFVIVSLLATGFFAFFCDEVLEVAALALVSLLSGANVLTFGVISRRLFEAKLQTGENKKLTFLFLAKFIMLFLSFGLGIHFMGNKIILCVLNYIVQLLALMFCLKKDSE